MSYRRLIPAELASLIADERLTGFRPSPFLGGGFEIKYQDRGAIARQTLAQMSWDAFRAYKPTPIKLPLAQQEQVLAAVGRLQANPTAREVLDVVNEVRGIVGLERLTDAGE